MNSSQSPSSNLPHPSNIQHAVIYNTAKQQPMSLCGLIKQSGYGLVSNWILRVDCEACRATPLWVMATARYVLMGETTKTTQSQSMMLDENGNEHPPLNHRN